MKLNFDSNIFRYFTDRRKPYIYCRDRDILIGIDEFKNSGPDTCLIRLDAITPYIVDEDILRFIKTCRGKIKTEITAPGVKKYFARNR
jgi:hypothetical protein